MLAFGCSNQLNHFFGAAEPFLNAVGIGAQSLCGESGGDARVGKARVFSDEANFVDADAGMGAVGEMDGEAIGKGCGFRPRFHKALNEIGEFHTLDPRQETDAGHSGGVEEIREVAFGGAGFKRDTVEEELRARGTQEQAAWPGGVDGCPELGPGRVKLASGARML